MHISTVAILLLFSKVASSMESRFNDVELSNFLSAVNTRLAELYNREVLANWHNEIEGPNDLIALLQSEIATKEILKYVSSISPLVEKFKAVNITNANLRRQLYEIPEVGYEALSKQDLAAIYELTAHLHDVYSSAKLCSFAEPNRCDLALVPDVQNILHSSRNASEIQHYWLEWRQRTGMAAQKYYEKFVELYRKMSKLNGFPIPSDFLYKDLEENSYATVRLLEKFMVQLRPLYEAFHAYVRHSLRKVYGSELIPLGKPYPQNLAEVFIANAYKHTQPGCSIEYPYSNVSIPNITLGLLQSGVDKPQRIFQTAADFFSSLGMPPLENNFWTDSSKPKAIISEDLQTCWHKAWKFYGMRQANFSYCTNVDDDRFLNMFEALSDVYYYSAMQQQPTLFQEEPFPNFGDGLGKTFLLAASSPKYLQKLKIVDENYSTKGARINRLYLQGLRLIFLLPVLYVLDRYRAEVLDSTIDISNNCAYWQLTEAYTGSEPPIKRTMKDFDAPAKLLIELDEQYTSQVMSIVLQFQLYKHFCELTGQYNRSDSKLPLDLCDLSNQSQIGPLAVKAMSLGSSQSYKYVLKILTNETELKLDGFLEYFEPLREWLMGNNHMENVEVGWESSNKCS